MRPRLVLGMLVVFGLGLALPAWADITVPKLRIKVKKKPAKRVMVRARMTVTGNAGPNGGRSLTIPARVLGALAKAEAKQKKRAGALGGLFDQEQGPRRIGLGLGLLLIAVGLVLTWRQRGASAPAAPATSRRRKGWLLPLSVPTALAGLLLIASSTVHADAAAYTDISVKTRVDVRLVDGRTIDITLPKGKVARECRRNAGN